VPADFVHAQIDSVLGDLGADCIKIGMLHRPEIIDAVADALGAMAAGIPVVLDPVMVAKGGAALLEDTATAALKARLLPLARLLTPNTPEAAALSGRKVGTPEDVAAAAKDLLGLGAEAVLMKGGHLAGDEVTDLLYDGEAQALAFSGPRIDTRHTHGTGCTLASACAIGLAQGMTLAAAVGRAHGYVRDAIISAPGFGSGHGPLNHAHPLKS